MGIVQRDGAEGFDEPGEVLAGLDAAQEEDVLPRYPIPAPYPCECYRVPNGGQIGLVPRVEDGDLLRGGSVGLNDALACRRGVCQDVRRRLDVPSRAQLQITALCGRVCLRRKAR